MISELSDLARLQMGRELFLQRREMDLVSLAQQVVADTKRTTTRRHRLRSESSVKQLTGEWDPVRLQRVLSNLLSNAIKYSPLGGETLVSLDVITDEEGSMASIKVADQGLGIPEADLPHIFERFYRGRNVLALTAGAGIGLSGVRQIIEQHGGKVEVQSVEGQGTIVTVLLPIRRPPT
jgi:signal transduction histidine kinase